MDQTIDVNNDEVKNRTEYGVAYGSRRNAS